MYILASLRQLILKNVDNEENKAVLGKWAIKFLDTMCNLYLKKTFWSRRIWTKVIYNGNYQIIFDVGRSIPVR